MPVYDMCCFNAVMSLVFPTWLEAEQGRLLVAHTYVLERAAAATLNPRAIDNIDRELRGLLLSRLTAKQEASAPPRTALQKIFAKPPNASLPAGLFNSHTGDATAIRQTYRNLGYGHRLNEFDIYPERVMDHEPLGMAWEARARELIQRGLIGNRRLDINIFGGEFSPYFDGREEPDSGFRFETSTNYVSNLNISGADQQANTSSPNASAAQSDQVNNNTNSGSGSGSGSGSYTNDMQSDQQDERKPSETEIERKKTKSRKKNQSRKANKKAKKGEQQQEEGSDESDTDSFIANLAKNFNLSTSETFHDSNIIPGMSSMTVSSYVRKPTGKVDTASRNEADKK
ncbi:hypothetical protein JADG_001886 [Aureobasidium aubasidani]|nr:hypothetical protein JADG_001886 [Aureobasidium pullulans]